MYCLYFRYFLLSSYSITLLSEVNHMSYTDKRKSLQKKDDITTIDWHRADVVAALKKRGLSVSALSRQHGLATATLGNCLRSPWPKGERIIADALGLEPQDIWPSRYQQLKRAS